MRIRTQFMITIFFSAVALVATSALVIITSKQVEKTSEQEKNASIVAQGAGELSYLANDYLIYREGQQLSRWESRFTSFSRQVAILNVDKQEQQALVRNIQANTNRLKEVFGSVAAAVRNSIENGNATVGAAFLQMSWSRMAVQSQGLVSDALRLSQILRDEMDRLRETRTILMLAMIGAFGVFLLAAYIQIYGRTLKAIAALHAGTSTIGSGNLNFKIEAKRNDEIGDLSRAFNQMTADLRAVTASKADLEREVLDRKKAEEALRRRQTEIQALFDNSPAGLVLFDAAPPYAVLVHNKYYQELFAEPFKSQGMVGLNVYDYAPEVEAAGVVAVFDEVVRTKQAKSFLDFPYRSNPPNESWFNWHMAPIVLDGKVISLVSMSVDVTDRHMAEEALRRAHNELELRVRERTAELQEANSQLIQYNRRLEELNRELQDFAFVASHDLQEPLRKVQTFGNMLIAKRDIFLDEASRDYLKRMQTAAARMQNLLNSLLEYSRVTTKAEPRKETDLKKSVEDALSNLEIRIRDKLARVEVGDMPTVRADRVQMIQLFQNLIGNALKFNREGEAPHVKIHTEETGDAYKIYVEDNGIGFEEKYLEKIFLPFQRLHGRSSNYEGVGMGLAICRKIVERHGGKIIARSESGKGSTFIVTLPAKGA